MVAAKLANMPAHRPPKNKWANLPTSEKKENEVSNADAASLLNVSERSVKL